MWNAEDRSRIGSIGHEAVQEHTPDRSLCWRALYVTHIDPNYSTRKLTGHATAHTTTNQELVSGEPVFRPPESAYFHTGVSVRCAEHAIYANFGFCKMARGMNNSQLGRLGTYYVLVLVAMPSPP